MITNMCMSLRCTSDGVGGLRARLFFHNYSAHVGFPARQDAPLGGKIASIGALFVSSCTRSCCCYCLSKTRTMPSSLLSENSRIVQASYLEKASNKASFEYCLVKTLMRMTSTFSHSILRKTCNADCVRSYRYCEKMKRFRSMIRPNGRDSRPPATF